MMEMFHHVPSRSRGHPPTLRMGGKEDRSEPPRLPRWIVPYTGRRRGRQARHRPSPMPYIRPVPGCRGTMSRRASDVRREQSQLRPCVVKQLLHLVDDREHTVVWCQKQSSKGVSSAPPSSQKAAPRSRGGLLPIGMKRGSALRLVRIRERDLPARFVIPAESYRSPEELNVRIAVCRPHHEPTRPRRLNVERAPPADWSDGHPYP